MFTRNTAKAIVRLVVAIGTYKIVGQVIDKNTDPPEKLTDKVTIRAGKVAIAGVVAVKAEKYSDGLVDQIGDGINEFKRALNA